MSRSKFCSYCGARLADDAAFCGKCGNRVYADDADSDGALSDEQEETTPAEKNNESGSCLGCAMVPVIAIVLLVVAIITCPDKEDHENEVRRVVREKVHTSSDGQAAAFLMGLMGGGGFYEECLLSQLKIECSNYLIFSIGTAMDDGKRVPISFGMFGNVILNEDED